MRNYVQPGNSLAIAVPYAGGLLSGQGVLVGALFGVAAVDGAQNALIEAARLAGVEANFDFRAAFNATATRMMTAALRNQQARTDYT